MQLVDLCIIMMKDVFLEFMLRSSSVYVSLYLYCHKNKGACGAIVLIATVYSCLYVVK